MESDPIQEGREARIAQLERKLARTSGVGVKAPVAVLAIALCIGLIGYERQDLAYFFGSSDPVNLGAEGEYRFEALHSNRYAQIHGVPTTRGAYSQEHGQTFVVIGLRDTPVLVRRAAFPGEQPPAQPNQTPFAVRGRLLARSDAGRYEAGFRLIEEMGEVRPRDGELWLLIEGERPGSDLLTALLSAALGAFALLNAFFLGREIAHRMRGKAAKSSKASSA